jgi:hypothetical protein
MLVQFSKARGRSWVFCSSKHRLNGSIKTIIHYPLMSDINRLAWPAIKNLYLREALIVSTVALIVIEIEVETTNI